jgi:DNA-binding HxlR family transcriptional regulator
MYLSCGKGRPKIFRRMDALFEKRLTQQRRGRYNTSVWILNSYLDFKGGKSMESRELPVCPVETTLSLISDRWKVLILRDLFTGTKRFGELKKSLTGISQKVLTANLKDMEANGLLTRKAYPEVPPRVEYTLTETGESLRPVLGAMFDWGMDYKRKNHSPGNERVDALGKLLHEPAQE